MTALADNVTKVDTGVTKFLVGYLLTPTSCVFLRTLLLSCENAPRRNLRNWYRFVHLLTLEGQRARDHLL